MSSNRTHITAHAKPTKQQRFSFHQVHLEDHALGLLDILNIRVLDHEHENQHQARERHSSRQHTSMSVSVRQLNSQSLLAANRVAELRRQTGRDQRDLILRGSRQVPRERGREDVCPDRAGDSGSDCAAEGSGDVQQGHRGGGVAVVDGGEHGELADEDEDCAADRDEDLAHDNIADVAVGLAEVDHQTERESVQRHGNVEQPPVQSRAADGVANDEQQHAGDDGEGVVDVPRLGDCQVKHDLQEGLEVEVPGVVGDLVHHV